jgi:predicted transcriptional regulator
MAGRRCTLSIKLPDDLAEELERLANESGRGERWIARRAFIEFLEDHLGYRRAVAILERDRDKPNLTLDEAKRELGLEG